MELDMLYDRLLEGIGEGITQALTRKPLSVEDGGLDVHVPEDSSSFSKHSRDWHCLNNMLPRMKRNDFFGSFMSLDSEELGLLDDLHYYGTDDADVKLFVSENDMDGFYVDMIHALMDYHISLYLDKAVYGAHLKDVMMQDCEDRFIGRYVNCIREDINGTDDLMYAYWKPSDLNELREKVVKYVPETSNLNWVDVSEMESLTGLFMHTWFNGDISLWDVRNVKNMDKMFYYSSFDGNISGWEPVSLESAKEMFSNSKFTGDISGWELPPINDSLWIFFGSKIPEEHKPLCLREKHVDDDGIQ